MDTNESPSKSTQDDLDLYTKKLIELHANMLRYRSTIEDSRTGYEIDVLDDAIRHITGEINRIKGEQV